jgi:hypothetical protein
MSQPLYITAIEIHGVEFKVTIPIRYEGYSAAIWRERRGTTLPLLASGQIHGFATHAGHKINFAVPIPVPLIYSGPTPVPNLTVGWRAFSLCISAACLTVLILAATVTPNPAGVGTHAELGMYDCQFLARTGLPCPSCGMTTSFAHFVRGNFLASLYVQPDIGGDLALMTGIAKRIEELGALDERFLSEHCDGWPALRCSLRSLRRARWLQ